MCACDIRQKCISTRWVIMEKFKDKRKIMKARIVAWDYEVDSHNLKTFLWISLQRFCGVISWKD